MSKLTAVTAALLVVLAGYGMADAATVTFKIELASTQVDVGASVAYSVKALVEDNTWWAGDPDYELDGGLSNWRLNLLFSSPNTGVAHNAEMSGKTGPNGIASVTIPDSTIWTTVNPGTLIGGIGGTGGTQDTAGGQAPLGAGLGWSYPTDATLKTRAEWGNGTWVTLYTSSISGVTAGTVDLTLDPQFVRVWAAPEPDGLAPSGIPGVTVVNAQLQVGSALNPTITIDTTGTGKEGGVGKDDWSQEPGWNNDLHSVAIASTITDATEVTWTLTNPNTGHTDTLPVTTEDFTLTMAMIKGLATLGAEVPEFAEVPGYDYDWVLTGTVNPSDSIFVFVPEPTTIGLLGFGVVGALLRRRRRA